jgi:WD40 repeat protein
VISVFRTNGQKVRDLTAHRLRLKGLRVVPRQSLFEDSAEDSFPLLVSASSDSTIKVWDAELLCKEGQAELLPLCSVDTKDRITALATSFPFALTGRKRTREEPEEPEENEDDSEEEETAPSHIPLSLRKPQHP